MLRPSPFLPLGRACRPVVTPTDPRPPAAIKSTTSCQKDQRFLGSGLGSSRFSPRPSWAFDPFPPSGGRLEWGEQHGLGTPPAFTPTLALPCRGGGKRRTGAAPENCMTLFLGHSGLTRTRPVAILRNTLE